MAKKSRADASTANFKYPLVIFIMLFTALGGVYTYYQEHEKSIKAEQERAEQLQLEKKREQREALQSLFDTYLNDFRVDLANRAQNYKKSRRLLSDIISPYNYESLNYAKENYTLLKNEIAPSLRRQADQILSLFQSYQKKLNAHLSKTDNETHKLFMEKWNAMNEKQTADYVDFFMKEEERLRAYEALVEFYYVNANLYTVDFKENRFIFKREAEEEQHNVLLNELKSLED